MEHSGQLRELSGFAGWQAYLLIVVALMVFAYLFGSHRSYLLPYLKAFYHPGERTSPMNSDVRLQQFQNVLTIFSIALYSVFVVLLLQGDEDVSLRTSTGQQWLTAWLLTLCLFLFKWLSYRLFSWINLPRGESKALINNNATGANLLAVILIFVILANEILKLGHASVLIGGIIVWAIVKAVSITPLVHYFSGIGVSAFQLILYLCGVEILPMCVWLKSIEQISFFAIS